MPSSASIASGADTLLVATGLCRTLSERAGVKDISLSLAAGDVIGLLGLNGAGKSTTLQLLCGVLACDSGKVVIAGHDLEQSPLLARRHIGYLPDQPPLYAQMRVRSYLNLAARLRQLQGSAVTKAVDQIIDQCQLADVSNLYIAELSKGFRQRLGLAQALVHDPDVVLLDEPSNGLDPQQMEEMRYLIRELAKTRSIIFSTHLLSEAQALCNRIVVMHQGRLVADEAANGKTLAELFTRLVNASEPDALAQ